MAERADSPKYRMLSLIDEVAGGTAPVGRLQAELLTDISPGFAHYHLVPFFELAIQLSDLSQTGETDENGANISVADKALRLLRDTIRIDERVYTALLDVSEQEESRLRIAQT